MTHSRARSGRYAYHHAWAIRLFALTVGSWLYRMEYGVWFALTGGIVIDGFNGRFDMIMAFFFYLPNLLIAELFIRSRRHDRNAVASVATTAILPLASSFILLATWRFTALNWGPKMMIHMGHLFS